MAAWPPRSRPVRNGTVKHTAKPTISSGNEGIVDHRLPTVAMHRSDAVAMRSLPLIGWSRSIAMRRFVR